VDYIDKLIDVYVRRGIGIGYVEELIAAQIKQVSTSTYTREDRLSAHSARLNLPLNYTGEELAEALRQERRMLVNVAFRMFTRSGKWGWKTSQERTDANAGMERLKKLQYEGE
jgi:hypothetical protein